jgi:hypothetical protein
MTRLVTPAVDLAKLAHTVIFNRSTRPTPARSPAQRHERMRQQPPASAAEMAPAALPSKWRDQLRQ